jgi:DNA-binding YbaB/EbfC family protein
MACEVLEKESGMKAGEGFALAHAPERVMVGRLIRNIQEHDRCVGGIDEVSTKRAVELYSPVLTKGKIIPMSATAAEVTKTAENTFRDLQIAAANELALYCKAMGINFYDVRAGIDSLKGDGITRAILWPGAGVGGGGNMQKQLQQMQVMQRKMEEMQAELETKEVEATAGGGAVSVTVNGKKEIVKVAIKPEVVDPDDVEMLQDLIMVAANEALRQIEEMSQNEMGKLTGGLSIPGLM